jgi:DNA-binding NtrC family response regulator
MRAHELTLDDVFEFDPSGGRFRFGGERAVLMDTVAIGLLREQLVRSFGTFGARAVLTRFGYSHGWRTAESFQHTIAWDDLREWRIAGGRLHRLLGMVSFEPVTAPSETEPQPFAEAIWPDSFEAEQHLLHHGQADECVCWSLIGFASGYLSRVNGRTIYCLETACRGKGDPVCRMVGRFKEDWDVASQALFAFYESDCLDKDLRALQASLRRTERRLIERRRELERLSDDESGLIAKSESMKKVISQAKRVAMVDSTILLHGESGSGKERIARLIHDSSRRQGGPFVAINCAAVPESLLESELFGHVRGAFTGAVSDRPGLFEAARAGTLVLDEVAELPLSMQAKLLRVLQEREVRRVGENKTRSIDVRLIAATHRDLTVEAKAGRFREDLLFRLRVVTLEIPPLRERREDIVPLARLALSEATKQAQLGRKELGPSVCRKLLSYRWPGNVRELFNAIERAVVLSERRMLQASDLPSEIVRPNDTSTVAQQTLESLERDAILQALRSEAGNRTRTAQRLGIGPATLFRKLKQYQDQGYEVVSA